MLEVRILPAAVTDTTAPRVLEVIVGQSTVTVAFSEEMATNGNGSVTDTSNWSLWSDAPNSVALIGSPTFGFNAAKNRYEAVLTTTGIKTGDLWSVQASGNLTDLAGNKLDGDGSGIPGMAYLSTSNHQAGQSDPSYGPQGTGNVTTSYYRQPPSTDVGVDTVIQADGKIVTVGYGFVGTTHYEFAVARLNSDGTPDTTFGTAGNGHVTLNLGAGKDSVATSAVIRPTGEIVISGYFKATDGKFHMAVVQLKSDGTTDSAFDGDGIADIKVGTGNSMARDIALQSNGSVIVAGSSEGAALPSGSDNFYREKIMKELLPADPYMSQLSDVAVVRLTSTGAKDNSFSGDGIWTQRIGKGGDYASAVAVQSDGAILLGGAYYVGTYLTPVYARVYLWQAMVFRLSSTGVFDSNFAKSTGGYFTPSHQTAVTDIALSGTKILVATQDLGDENYFPNVASHIALTRLTSAGVADTTFGGAAGSDVGQIRLATAERFDSHSYVNEIAVDASGATYLVGTYGVGGDYYYGRLAVTRITSAGKLDTTFGRNGTAVLSTPSDYGNRLVGVALDSSGRIVATGIGYEPLSSGMDEYVVRLLPSGAMDSSFNPSLTEIGMRTLYFDSTLVPTTNYAEAVSGLVTVGEVWNGVDYDIAVTRHKTDGTLDLEFAQQGRFQISLLGNDYAKDVAVQPDGKIVITGYTVEAVNGGPLTSLYVMRLKADGTLDDQFGNGTGYNATSFSGYGDFRGNHIALQPDGKIVVVGSYKYLASDTAEHPQFLVARFAADGTLTSNERKVFAMGNGDSFANSVAIDGKGNIVVVGSTIQNGRTQIAVARLTATLGFDGTFDGDGKALNPLGLSSVANDVAIDAQGNVVVVGTSTTTKDSRGTIIKKFVEVRYRGDNGALDLSFAGNGFLLDDPLGLGADSEAAAVAIQADGSIVIAGDYAISGHQRFVVRRLNANGTPDTRFFNSLGSNSYTVGVTNDDAKDLYIDNNGAIFVVGTIDLVAGDVDTGDFVFKRIYGDSPPVGNFTFAGGTNNVPLSFTVTATDTSPTDVANAFTFNFDWNNDGIVDEHIGRSTGSTITHIFAAPGTYTVRMTATDRKGMTGPAITKSIAVGANQQPVFTYSGSSISYTERSPALAIAPDVTITDTDSPNFSGGQIVVALTGDVDASDRILITNQGTGSGKIGISGNTVTYGGFAIGTWFGGQGATPLVINLDTGLNGAQALLRQITFSNDSHAPTTGLRQLKMTMTDGDSLLTPHAILKTIQVIPVNDPPVLDGPTSTLTYWMTRGSARLGDSLTVTDVDTPLLEGGILVVQPTSGGGLLDRLRVAETAVLHVDSGVLIFNSQDIGDVISDGKGGTPLQIRFNSDATIAMVQTVLNNVEFVTESDAAEVGTRAFAISLTDGLGGNSNVINRSVSVTYIDDFDVGPIADLDLIADSVDENSSGGTYVHLTALAVDQDAKHAVVTYSLTDDAGGRFTIDEMSGLVRVADGAVLDFESATSHAITIEATSQDGSTSTKSVVITVTNVDEGARLLMSGTTVPENKPSGTVVGTLSVADMNVTSPAYSLVSGAGGTDNSKFSISGNQLKTKAKFNFEAKSSYSVRVQMKGSGGVTLVQVITIAVTNVNEGPTGLTLSPSSISENNAVGGVVGTFAGVDPDTGDALNYTLVSGSGSTDNGRFTIEGNELKAAESFDYEKKKSYKIRVRVTDANGLFYEKTLTINVTNGPG